MFSTMTPSKPPSRNATASSSSPDNNAPTSSADSAVASELRSNLVDQGFEVVSDEDMEPGMPWAIEIENALKMSPFVGEAIVIGDKRKFVSALLAIDFDATSEWAQRKRIAHTTYRDLSEKPEVRELLQKVVTETNQHFASAEQVKKFDIITKELDHEDGELTATMKIKRSVIEDQFTDQIEALYR